MLALPGFSIRLPLLSLPKMSVITRDTPSTRSYLIRALHEWCTDNGFSPYIAVQVDASVQVPMEFVKNGEIVLNVSFDATSSLRLGHDFVEFKARFGGVTREILVPIDHVIAIYARENGQGMAFPAPHTKGLAGSAASPSATATDDAKAKIRSNLHAVSSEDVAEQTDATSDDLPPTTPGSGGGPKLRLIK
jgi:stringent starvation protein B